MTTRLLLSPVGTGKTEMLLRHLADVTTRQPFARVWVLLPNERQIYAFRQRMVAGAGGRRVYFNIGFYNFYSLYRHLLDTAGQPQRSLDEAARFRLLRGILRDLRENSDLPLFGRIADTRGFAHVTADFIYELKQNFISPEVFAGAAQRDKDGELAWIYAEYQRVLLEHALVDREGEGWVALDAATNNPLIGRNVNLLLVDGFDHFTPLQAQLIRLLSERVGETLVTLTVVPGREATIGRRFERARERLRNAHATFPLEERTLAGETTHRQPALRHLLDNLFTQAPVLVPAGDAVTFIEAPEVGQEVKAVLRRVKTILLGGVAPGDVLITLRDWGEYAPHFAPHAAAYGLSPLLAMQSSEMLAENPAILALLDLLELPNRDFRRRELLDALRCPYFDVPGFSDESVTRLEQVSRALRVTGGRRAWLDAIERAARTRVSRDEETLATLLSPGQAESLARHLDDFFRRVSPPDEANVTFYIGWLEALMGPDPETVADDEDVITPPDVVTLNMIGRLRQPAPYGIVERDLVAMKGLKDVLRSLMSVQELVGALGGETRVTWADFLSDLRAVLLTTPVQRVTGREGRVLVTTVTEARGLPHKHVFILGLSEGVFPARVPEDPLYLDSERRAFAERGIPLQTQAERADDDGLFYEMLSLARESLTLSRPYIHEGAPWLASHLWRAAAAVFADSVENIQRHRVPLAGVIPPEAVASLGEAALAAADGLNDFKPAPNILRLRDWLLADAERGAFWRRIRHARAVELSRMSRAPYDSYSGRLSHPDLIEYVAGVLDDNRVWSASQLNEVGICGFRFFARRLLHLDVMDEPEDGMTNLHVGSIYHAVLERTYGRLREMKVSIGAASLEIALEVLHRTASEVFRSAPDDYGFRVSALWEQEQQVLRRRLERLVRDDFTGSNPLRRYGDGARVPLHLELAFGETSDDSVRIEVGYGVEPLRVRGVIDRIDRVGSHAVLVDYKTGATKIDTKELARGRNFQMMVYLLAAEQRLSHMSESLEVDGGVFWHIGSDANIGSLWRGDEASEDAIANARDHLGRYIGLGRRGDFAAQVNKAEEGKCTKYCDYSQFCRASIMHRRKLDS